MKTPLALFLAFILTCQTASFAADRSEYLASFDPAKGFKPAQTDLTEIFLQIAGSLEYYGSPEPYLRHMAKEHERIEALYLQKNGKAPTSHRPAYMTDEYINHLSKIGTCFRQSSDWSPSQRKWATRCAMPLRARAERAPSSSKSSISIRLACSRK